MSGPDTVGPEETVETSSRLIIIGGNYGVGKSEVSVSLALRLQRDNPTRPITLIDLDVVNPYFRSREARKILEKEGIRVIGNSLGIDTGVDLPAIPGTVAPALRDASQRVIVDLGGDPVGARVLRQFRPSIPTEDTTFLFVFNRYREANRDVESAISALRAIENVVGIGCTGIVNNTHMLAETTPDHIVEGDRVAKELATSTAIPIVYVAAVPGVLRAIDTSEISDRDGGALSGAPLEIVTALREGWMNTGNEHTKRR